MIDWRVSLSKSQLGVDEFVELCLLALKEIFPETSVKLTEEKGKLQVQIEDSKPFTVYLNNLWVKCRLYPENRVIEVERFFRILINADTDRGDSPPAIDSIIPTIKDEEYLRISRVQDGHEPKFVHEHLIADLWIVYAVDLPDRIVTFQKSDFDAMEIDLRELRNLAIHNLRNILPPIQQHGKGPLYTLTGSDYVASLILLDEIWDKMQTPVEGEIVAAIPSRDLLLFTGSDSRGGLLSMRSQINRLHESGCYLVSPSMLRRHKGKWLLFS